MNYIDDIQKRLSETLWKNCGVSDRHRDTVVNFDNKEWAKLSGYLFLQTGLGYTIGLVGIRGNGKTQMAVELIRDRTKSCEPCLITTAVAFFMAVKATYRKDSDETEEDVVARYAKPQLLVIDEFGKRGESDWANNLLFELLNRRYGAKLDTILIDNRTKAEFVEALGPSLASRMSECGGIVECNWASFRSVQK